MRFRQSCKRGFAHEKNLKLRETFRPCFSSHPRLTCHDTDADTTFHEKRNRTSPGFTLPLRVDKMRGYLVASTQRWASCMAHAKVPVRASVSKFPACAVGGVDAKAERSTSGKFHFISRFFPDDLLAGMLRAEHAGSNLFGDDAFLVISFFPGTSRPPPASWREDTRSSHPCPRRKSDIL